MTTMQSRGPRLKVSTLLGDEGLRQVAVTVVLGLLVLAATLVLAAAEDRWEASVTAERRWSAGAVETLRFVYEEEAFFALDVAFAEQRATAMGAAGETAGPDGDRARFEEEVAAKWAYNLRNAYEGSGSLLDEKYALPGGGFDVAVRLADVESESAEVLLSEPSVFVEGADRTAVLADVLAAAVVPVVVAYLVVDAVLVGRERRARSGGDPAAVGDGDLEPVPRPWAAAPGRRVTAVVALAAWLLLALVPVAQVRTGAVAARAGAEAERLAVHVAGSLEGAMHYRSFAANAARTLVTDEIGTLARESAAISAPADLAAAEAVVTATEARMRPGRGALVDEMTRLPTTADGVGERLAAFVAASPYDVKEILDRRASLLDTSAKARGQSNGYAVALLLASLTLTLVAVSATGTGRRFPAVRYAQTLTLAGAVVAVVTGGIR